MSENVFEVAGGSIPGRDHLFWGGLLIGRNNQDAIGWQSLTLGGESLLLGAVCDGCGSRPHSEVGAKIGNGLLLSSLARRLRQNSGECSAQLLEAVRQDVLAQIRGLALSLAGEGSLSAAVADSFLFTVVGFVLSPQKLWIFSVGDGVLVVNGELKLFGPFPDNTPPYLSYGIIDSSFSDKQELLKFALLEYDASAVSSFLVGTDGVEHLNNAANRLVPGLEEAVGPLSRFWEDDKVFKNRDLIRRKLALMNSEVSSLDRARGQIQTSCGLLPDDTTFIVGRRRKPGSNTP